MVPKPAFILLNEPQSFRAVLFRMVPKLRLFLSYLVRSFRAVLFRMVPKLFLFDCLQSHSFRAVLFRMVPKLGHVVKLKATIDVLETFLSAIKHDDGEIPRK